MSVTPFNRFIFPATACADGDAVELMIIKTPTGNTPIPYAGDGNAAHTVNIADVFQPVSIGTLTLAKHDADGDICVPSSDFVINDSLVLTGTSNSVAISYDFSTSKTSLIDEIFSDVPGSTFRYDLYLTNFHGPVGAPTKEVYFKGTIDITQISKTHVLVASEFTTNAQRVQAVTFKAVSAIGDLKAKTAQDLVTAIVAGTVTPQFDAIAPMYAGQTNMTKLHDNSSSTSFSVALQYNWSHSTTFPRSVSIVELPRIIQWIATLCNMATATIDASMQFDLYGQNYSSLRTGYWPLTKRANTWFDVYICLNFLLGMPITDNPPNSSVPSGNYQDLFVQWPCSFNRSDTLDKLVQWVAIQTGCYVDYSIDTTGAFTFQLVGRRSQNRILPTNFQLMDGSTEEAQSVGKSSVILQMQGDNMQALCGPNANDAVTLTIPWRCHKWGTPVGNTSTTPPGYHPPDFMELWWDRNLADSAQGLAVTVEKKEDGNYFSGNVAWQNPTDKGWIGGSLLYYLYTGGGSFYAPGTFNAPASGANIYAAFAAILPKGFTLGTDEYLVSSAFGGEGFFNPLTAYAKFYYQELVGNRLVLKQKFYGCKGDDGKIQSVKPDMHMSTFIRGSLRTFLAHEVILDRIACTTEITWIEVPATYPDAALAVSVVQQNGSSSSVGSSSASSGSGGTTGNFLKEFPITTADNTVTLASDLTGLTVKAFASQTVDLSEWYDTAGTKHTWFDKDGDIHSIGLVATNSLTASAPSFTGALNMNSHLIDNVTDPVSAQDAATKHYVDNATSGLISQAVIIAPGTAGRNTIHPTTTGVVGLIIKSNDNATDYLQLLDDTGATVATWHGSTGQLVLPYVRVVGAGTVNSAVATLDSGGQINGVAQTNGQLLIGSTGNIPVAGALTSSDSSITVSNSAGAISLTVTPNANYRLEQRTCKFYSGGSVIKTIPFTVAETWDSTSSVWIPQWGFALPFDATTGSTYGWNSLFQFHKKGTEHGNVEIVGISSSGVPDYWANAVTQVKQDTGTTANQNVYYGSEFQFWSEDQGAWLLQRPLEKVSVARRIDVHGRIFITGTNPAVTVSWVNLSDPLFPMSDKEILKDSDKDGATATAPVLTWLPATPSLLIDFGTRLKPVALHCAAYLSNAAGGIAYNIGAMPCRNQVGTVNQATVEFWRMTVAAGALSYTPRTDPTAPPGQTEAIYVDVWGQLEIIGDDARTL